MSTEEIQYTSGSSLTLSYFFQNRFKIWAMKLFLHICDANQERFNKYFIYCFCGSRAANSLLQSHFRYRNLKNSSFCSEQQVALITLLLKICVSGMKESFKKLVTLTMKSSDHLKYLMKLNFVVHQWLDKPKKFQCQINFSIQTPSWTQRLFQRPPGHKLRPLWQWHHQQYHQAAARWILGSAACPVGRKETETETRRKTRPAKTPRTPPSHVSTLIQFSGFITLMFYQYFYCYPTNVSLPLSTVTMAADGEMGSSFGSSGLPEKVETTAPLTTSHAPFSSVPAPAPVVQETPQPEMTPPPPVRAPSKPPPLPVLRFPKVRSGWGLAGARGVA